LNLGISEHYPGKVCSYLTSIVPASQLPLPVFIGGVCLRQVGILFRVLSISISSCRSNKFGCHFCLHQSSRFADGIPAPKTYSISCPSLGTSHGHDDERYHSGQYIPEGFETSDGREIRRSHFDRHCLSTSLAHSTGNFVKESQYGRECWSGPQVVADGRFMRHGYHEASPGSGTPWVIIGASHDRVYPWLRTLLEIWYLYLPGLLP
jgi:hypothetical protein